MSFTPIRMPITAITQAIPTVVTVGVDHNMTTGQVVRAHVPREFGMVELNQKLFSITVLSARTFSLQYTQVPIQVDVDSRFYQPFVYVAISRFTAEILPVGSGPTPVVDVPWQTVKLECESLLGDATANISTIPIPF